MYNNNTLRERAMINLSTNHLLQKRITKADIMSSLKQTMFKNDELTELRQHISHLKELNGRLQYMMTEIHSLVTNT